MAVFWSNCAQKVNFAEALSALDTRESRGRTNETPGLVQALSEGHHKQTLGSYFVKAVSVF